MPLTKKEYVLLKNNIIVECSIKFKEKPSVESQNAVKKLIEIVMNNLKNHVEDDSPKCWGC